MDGLEDLTQKATAQIGLYAHPSQDSRTFTEQPGVVNSCYPSPIESPSGAMDGLEGSAEVFCCSTLWLVAELFAKLPGRR
jgi:hypothetical protein